MTDRVVQIENQTVGERLIALKERSGLSLAKIARGAGYQAASSIQKLFKPEYDPQRLNHQVAKRLAVALEGRGFPPIQADDILDLAAGLDAREHFNRQYTLMMREEKSDIPVYKSTISLKKIRSKSGALVPVFALALSTMPERFPAPSHLDMRNLVGFRVVTGNMWPKFEHGELLWYSESDNARIGDIVIVALGGDRDDPTPSYLLGRLANFNDGEVRISQLYPDTTHVLDREQVQGVKRIMTYEDLMPVGELIR